MEKLIKPTIFVLLGLSVLFLLFGIINAVSVHNSDLNAQIKEYEEHPSLYEGELAPLKEMKAINTGETFGAFFGGALAALVSFVSAIVIYLLNSIRKGLVLTSTTSSVNERHDRLEKVLRK